MNFFYLSNFSSLLTFLYFYGLPIFILILIIIVDYFCYYSLCCYDCLYYFFIFNACNFCFSSFYHSVLSLYISDIFEFKGMTRPKHCSKLALKILRLYQVFDEKFEHCLLNLFFWRSSVEVILLHFALDNYIFYSVSIF